MWCSWFLDIFVWLASQSDPFLNSPFTLLSTFLYVSISPLWFFWKAQMAVFAWAETFFPISTKSVTCRARWNFLLLRVPVFVIQPLAPAHGTNKASFYETAEDVLRHCSLKANVMWWLCFASEEVEWAEKPPRALTIQHYRQTRTFILDNLIQCNIQCQRLKKYVCITTYSMVKGRERLWLL